MTDEAVHYRDITERSCSDGGTSEGGGHAGRQAQSRTVQPAGSVVTPIVSTPDKGEYLPVTSLELYG